MSDQAVLLPNWFTHGGITLAKGQLGHSYNFWTMSILIFSPVANFGQQSIYLNLCLSRSENQRILCYIKNVTWKWRTLYLQFDKIHRDPNLLSRMQYAVCVFQPPLASYAFFPPFQNNGMAMRDESQDHNLILKLEFQWHIFSHFWSLISKGIL